MKGSAIGKVVLFLLLLGVAGGVFWFRMRQEAKKFAPAKPAPPPVVKESKTPIDAPLRPFAVLDLEGKEAALKDLRGTPPPKMLVMAIWSTT